MLCPEFIEVPLGMAISSILPIIVAAALGVSSPATSRKNFNPVIKSSDEVMGVFLSFVCDYDIMNIKKILNNYDKAPSCAKYFINFQLRH
jgi:hypothetical protein